MLKQACLNSTGQWTVTFSITFICPGDHRSSYSGSCTIFLQEPSTHKIWTTNYCCLFAHMRLAVRQLHNFSVAPLHVWVGWIGVYSSIVLGSCVAAVYSLSGAKSWRPESSLGDTVPDAQVERFYEELDTSVVRVNLSIMHPQHHVVVCLIKII